MINFIVYDEGGTIAKTGICNKANMQMQAKSGQYVIEGIADDSKHIIVDGQVVDKDVDNSIFIDELRLNRNMLLSETDWTQIPDVPLTDTQKEQYKKYRKALRDLPSKYDTINSIDEVIYPRLEDFNEE